MMVWRAINLSLLIPLIGAGGPRYPHSFYQITIKKEQINKTTCLFAIYIPS
jgi:hypothetical protein